MPSFAILRLILAVKLNDHEEVYEYFSGYRLHTTPSLFTPLFMKVDAVDNFLRVVGCEMYVDL